MRVFSSRNEETERVAPWLLAGVCTPKGKVRVNSTKKRRGHNEGSIYKRKDGRWVAAMTVEGGKRKEYSGKTREEVRQKLAKAHYEREQLGVLPTTGSTERQTLKQYLASWLETVKPPILEENTWRQH